MAKRAEQTMVYELMRPEFDELSIIKFSYWDAGRKWLLAGEQLALDLRRLELAYLEHNRRDYEMTKHVSLARLDPRTLLQLRATGTCLVDIPVWLFDMDRPGQNLRRIKTVAVTIPAVTGPYTTVHASCRCCAAASGRRRCSATSTPGPTLKTVASATSAAPSSQSSRAAPRTTVACSRSTWGMNADFPSRAPA